MNGAAHPPILILNEPTPIAINGLPSLSANLFQRIIRDPRPESPHARERECAEMLAAVLLNAPRLRQHILGWMATLCGLPNEVISGLEFDIQTEQFIGSKRDDLRITGWRQRDDDDAVPTILWTIEIKVGSTFHPSTLQPPSDVSGNNENFEVESAEETLSDEIVNQLRNYDDWLARQQANHCAGFVLALRDVSASIPSLGLSCRWECFSWTSLGTKVQGAIADNTLSADEALLAKHLLGFIISNLWRSSEMPDAKLDFNDIALIRAFAITGRECAAKTSRLTALLVPLVEKSGVGVSKPVAQDRILQPSARSMVYRYLVPGLENDPHPSVSVGIAYESGIGDYLGVIVEVGPKQPAYGAICDTVPTSLKNLKSRNPAWTAPPTDSEHWAILALRFPLTNLLGIDDQEGHLSALILAGLDDLKESGAVASIAAATGGKARRT